MKKPRPVHGKMAWMITKIADPMLKCPRSNRSVMAPNPLSAQVSALDDEALAHQATVWRSRAAQGDRSAFGIAHALEVEQRRRVRETERQALPEVPRAARPWWKFWDNQAKG
ncbi:hypothetical protein QTH87_25695 [Variovorax sp. J22P168]|uniref:hypothetical protein n=1 Tax=Variovorax jilinensis TaxID=3053513 RepID=UPI00257803FD|nr:hypothetical protein [Variovorax sp. J22P168]MDM0015859.1 hypothetical protein [Variovorax sp. J22P168]